MLVCVFCWWRNLIDQKLRQTISSYINKAQWSTVQALNSLSYITLNNIVISSKHLMERQPSSVFQVYNSEGRYGQTWQDPALQISRHIADVCRREEERWESRRRMLWQGAVGLVFSHSQHSARETAKSYASRLLPSATDTTELVITQNNGTDTSNRLKKNEEFGHDERRKTKKAINYDT